MNNMKTCMMYLIFDSISCISPDELGKGNLLLSVLLNNVVQIKFLYSVSYIRRYYTFNIK
ncbi:hypothetical protein SAMN02745781_01548 [Vibrio gazogenes DSM 21264]|uniref:Uncharacterized protein n=1 Tax=Vibrio gazogenes DSM 21264 = NBRC 103151 TaxID=1123492 RepID=A0A1M4ZC06_VIBGA|nr:hypothetical protein SAMN02745781_01548 [Vibrio gazogenes DSM 21264] [Vibrio gazogenes DSM 21264 = NBRC 103151]